MIQFLHKKLFVRNEETKHLEDAELALYLLRKLNRPIRVCGMVRNSGEPGGGPLLLIIRTEPHLCRFWRVPK